MNIMNLVSRLVRINEKFGNPIGYLWNGEFPFPCMFIFLSVMISENDFPNWDKHKVQIVFLILFSFSFFIYRFTVITYFKQNSVLFFNYLFNFVKMVICRCISY